jgi:hypothetical protein
VPGFQSRETLSVPHFIVAFGTGYIASESFLETVMKVVEKLRFHNPDLIYGTATKQNSRRAVFHPQANECPGFSEGYDSGD